MNRSGSFSDVGKTWVIIAAGLIFLGPGLFMLGTFGAGEWKLWHSAGWERVPAYNFKVGFF